MKPRSHSRGAAAVEFALVVTVLVILLFGLIELGRALFEWNSAVDAVRRGARAASIAAQNDRATVLAEMRVVFPDLQDENVTLEYSATGAFPGGACTRGTCSFVRVSITGYTFHTLIFFLPADITMPAFSTTYPVEALGAT